MTRPEDMESASSGGRVERIWLDTEFIEDGVTIDLISIGMVREDGAELYLESTDCKLEHSSPWVRENVIPHLQGGYVRASRPEIADAIKHFAGKKPEFWGYYADYDWIALCQLFGTMMDLPKGWPMYCRDIKQWCDDLGNPKLPEQGKGEHHALADARWNREAWKFLRAHSLSTGNASKSTSEPNNPSVAEREGLIQRLRAYGAFEYKHGSLDRAALLKEVDDHITELERSLSELRERAAKFVNEQLLSPAQWKALVAFVEKRK